MKTGSANAFWPLLFDDVPDGVCICGPGGRILYMNRAAENMLGVEMPRIAGKPLCELLCGRMTGPHGSDCASDCSLKKPSGDKAVTLKGEFSREKRALRVRCLKIPASPLSPNDPENHLTWIEDVQAEAELERRKEEWRHMVVHDIKAPLTSVLGALQIIQDVPEARAPDSGERLLVGMGIEAARRIMNLLDLYLDSARLDAEHPPAKRERVRLAPLVQACADGSRFFMRSRRIELATDIPAGLEVEADPELLSRIVQNLLMNALKFSPEGGRVLVSGKTGAGGVFLSIRDSGPGISPQDAAKLFQPFQTGSSGPRGTGLGLAFCRRAVSAMGGTISFNAPKSGGGEFTISLPG